MEVQGWRSKDGGAPSLPLPSPRQRSNVSILPPPRAGAAVSYGEAPQSEGFDLRLEHGQEAVVLAEVLFQTRAERLREQAAPRALLPSKHKRARRRVRSQEEGGGF